MTVFMYKGITDYTDDRDYTDFIGGRVTGLLFEGYWVNYPGAVMAVFMCEGITDLNG